MQLFDRAVGPTEWLQRYEGSSIVVDLSWQLPADLDLGVVYRDRGTKEPVLLYYDKRGSRSSYPYLHLGSDATGEGRTKLRREHLVATRLDEHEQIDVLVWDHDCLIQGIDSSFATDSQFISICASDSRNFRYPIDLAPNRMGNCIHAVRIKDGAISLIDNITTLSAKDSPMLKILDFVDSCPEVAA